MTASHALAGVVLLAGLAAAPAAAQAPAPIRGVGVDESYDSPAVLAPALERAGVMDQADHLKLFVRLFVPWAVVRDAAAAGRWDALDARIADDAHAPLLLVIDGAPLTTEQSGAWSGTIRALATHLRGRVAGYEIEAAAAPGRPDAATYAYLLKLAAVQARAADGGALIAETTVAAGDLDWVRALYQNDLATAVDIVPVAAGGDAARIVALVRERDPSAVVLTAGVPLPSDTDAAASRWLTAAVSVLGEAPAAVTVAGPVDAVAAALRAAAPLGDVLGGEIVTLDPGSVSLAMARGGADAAAVPHRLLYNLGNGSTYFVYWDAGTPASPLDVRMVERGGRAPVLRDPIHGTATPATGFAHDAATQVSHFTAPASTSPIIADFNYGAEGQFLTSAEVSGAASLSVEEIVFREQQAMAVQRARYETYSASLQMRLHFRATASQVFDVVSENRVYAAGDDVEWEETSFSVNGAKWGADRPGFPLLQAEKVLSLPLDLRLTADYRYRLAGVETVDGRRCYVVEFEPQDAGLARYRGRVWIDAASFLRVRTEGVETHLEGEIVSNQVTETYGPVATIDGQTIQFPTHVATRQILLIAGRNLLLERDDRFSDFRMDAADFLERREAARTSDRIMFRDTDQGVRYFVKQGAERVVSQRLTRSSRALAMGTTVDPTFAFPLPIFGINYLNFRFLDSNSQLALLFGGVFAAGTLQTPRLGRTPFDGSVDFFGIAVPGTDELFDTAGEHVDERVLAIPASTGAHAGWQFSPFQKVTLGYQFRFDKYFAGPDTSAGFVVPASTVTHGIAAGYEYRRNGYALMASAAQYHRMRWTPWGRPGDYDPAHQTYRQYSVGGSKDFLMGTFQTIHAGAAWYGGRNLDRFSMYQFGLFTELQMHGVPSSGVRFPSLGLARLSYSFNLFDQYRLDLFLDQAVGRDPGDRRTWRPVTGTGVAVTLRTPWNTMLTVDIGKSILPPLYRRAGSRVVQVMLLKPF